MFPPGSRVTGKLLRNLNRIKVRGADYAGVVSFRHSARSTSQPTAFQAREIRDISIARISAETRMVYHCAGHTPNRQGQDLFEKR